MTNKELISKFKAVLNAADKLRAKNVPNEVYFRDIEPIKKEFTRFMQMGVISLLTKKTIFKAVQFQSSFRPMPEHRFYIYFLNK